MTEEKKEVDTDSIKRYLKLSAADRIKHLESKASLFTDLAISCSGARQPARIMDMNAVEGKAIYEHVGIAVVEAAAADLIDEVQKIMNELRQISELRLPCSTEQQSRESVAKRPEAS